MKSVSIAMFMAMIVLMSSCSHQSVMKQAPSSEFVQDIERVSSER